MKNLKRLLIPVMCLLLCVTMALPAYAFSPSDPDASPIEIFFDGISMMLGLLFLVLIQFAVPILIGAGIVIAVVAVVVILVVVIKKKRRKASHTN
ncbi:MAG: hypothetical protein J6R05_01640 [Bacteroidaceae bacterium]|nr:hypothetical protein [Bacteroidaceae bacterium]